MDLELRKVIQQFIYMDNFRKDEQKDFCNSFKDIFMYSEKFKQKFLA